jgi:hypothetical protein
MYAEMLSIVEPPHPLAHTNGITSYLHTMFAVAHTPGICHWCTPGHNRGKASEALARTDAMGVLRGLYVVESEGSHA